MPPSLSYQSDVAPTDQAGSLQVLAGLVYDAICSEKPNVSTSVHDAALRIVSGCPSKDELCELTAVFDAVAFGTTAIPGMEHGLKYVADPRPFDRFVAPWVILDQLKRGVNGSDCDEHAALLAALLGNLGFSVGVRMFKPAGASSFEHVYCVVRFDPNSQNNKADPPENSVVALDTTEPEMPMGWEASPGSYEEIWVT